MNRIFHHFIKIYSTVFCIGCVRYFPGSICSLFTSIIFYFFYIFFLKGFSYTNNIQLFFFTLKIFLSLAFWVACSCWIVQIYIKIFNPVEIDSKEIVIDEFIGQFFLNFLCFFIQIFFEIYFDENLILYLTILFFLFRFFDILKPWPIYIIDNNYKNAFSILLDDILAAIFAFIFFISYLLILFQL
ncbi:MAG: phosphatidylglycerophosphatase A [Rickettsia sp.]|nr:phosphatidylglycerophosphatase A [Rickettsia sp.]